MYLILKVLVFALILESSVQGRSKTFSLARSRHVYDELSDSDVSTLSKMTDIKNINDILDNILIPRVVGTPNHEKVANYIANTMEVLGWSVERHRFKDQAPIFGELQFQNIIAKLNPNADRFLVLACHYDSKYQREHTFVGATDSAVPCAMMMNLAKVMQKQLTASKSNNDVSLSFIFFDGEEAFRTWNADDSIYGARRLAADWERRGFRSTKGENVNELDRMDLFVLLDLLGARNPTVYNYFSNTGKWFNRLSNAEERLSEMGKLRSYKSQYFIPIHYGIHIEDDHLPFLRRGVPILHIIPTPFPDVWHTPRDDRSVVHMDTVENLNKIFRVFIAEYLHLKL